MLNKYYYLVSSLPLLRFDEKPDILKKEFLAECGKWLSPPEFNILNTVDMDSSRIPFTNKQILIKWKSMDFSLREDLSKAREITQGASDERLPASMLSIFDKETPFLMEKELARKQWAMLDVLELGNYFDMNVLIIYFLKLQILERFADFNKDEGMRVFKDACEVSI